MGYKDALNPNMGLLLVGHSKGDLPAYLQAILRALGGLKGPSLLKKMAKNGAKVYILGKNHPLIQGHGVRLVSIVSS